MTKLEELTKTHKYISIRPDFVEAPSRDKGKAKFRQQIRNKQIDTKQKDAINKERKQKHKI